MKTLPELTNEVSSRMPMKIEEMCYTLSLSQLESLINEVISQRLGEPVAQAYINVDGECEQIDWLGTIEPKIDDEFTPLYALNIES